jgi:hypothetical protein
MREQSVQTRVKWLECRAALQQKQANFRLGYAMDREPGGRPLLIFARPNVPAGSGGKEMDGSLRLKSRSQIGDS